MIQVHRPQGLVDWMIDRASSVIAAVVWPDR